MGTLAPAHRWLLTVSVLLAGSANTLAQSYPSKGLRLIVSGPTVIPHSRAGKLRLIATASERRSNLLPELPTVGETLPGILVSAWYGVQVPASTPREIITRLNADIVRAVTTEKVARSIIAAGLEPVTNSPEEFATYIRSQTAVWGKVVKDAGIRIG